MQPQFPRQADTLHLAATLRVGGDGRPTHAAHVKGDITGVTGLAIIDAILVGERDPDQLASWREPSIQASPEIIRQSLLGDWRREPLFVLQQTCNLYRTYRRSGL